jgi:dynein heavy chain 1
MKLEFFNLQQDQVEKYITKYLIYSILWSMAGDGRLKSRQELGDFLRGITDISLPPTTNQLIIDFEVALYSSLKMWYM